MIPHAGFASAFPLLSYEFEHGEPHSLRREFHGVVRWFAVLAAAGLAIAAQPILVLTYGESFASAAPVVVWIAVGLLPSLVNNSRKVFLYASGQEAVAVKWTTVSMGVQLVAAAALIPSLAAVGAAVAMLLGDVVIWWPLRQSHRVQEEPGPHGVPGRRGIRKLTTPSGLSACSRDAEQRVTEEPAMAPGEMLLINDGKPSRSGGD
jgi:peptidoglycan biosynthesis protein MviN/MurJ (putative lipid II flippase)